jgi:putative glycosyltransferase (TIGR04372 family)
MIRQQIRQYQQRRFSVAARKIKRVLRNPFILFLLIFTIPVIVLIRLIRPWLLIRYGSLYSRRIGHFTANTELYLCENEAGINTPKQHHVDLFFMGPVICNQQLAKMWKRILRILPNWIFTPLHGANWLIPGGAVHLIGGPTQGDRDVHSLWNRFPPHLKFTAEEERQGQAALTELGVPSGADFVCFHARDSAYLDSVGTHLDPEVSVHYHDYLDVSVQNFMPAAERLSDNGYYVIRMGAIVKEPLPITNTKIIDYASSGRTDFLDIYLGATCRFAFASPSGYSAVPMIFRRPLVLVNQIGLEYMATWGENYLLIPKKLWFREDSRFLTFRDIIESGFGWFQDAAQYEEYGIEVVENTPEEIAEVVVEMDARLNGEWQTTEEDEKLQQRFWELFNHSHLHGAISARIGTEFLRQNQDFLE